MKNTLKNLGYNETFYCNKTGEENNYLPARIVAEHKKTYILRNDEKEISAVIPGKMVFNASSRIDYPTVGDFVLIEIINNEQALIKEILPRKTILTRKSVSRSDEQVIAANIDFAVIIQALDRDFNLNRFERYITVVKNQYITPILVINKTDLLNEIDLAVKLSEIELRFPDIDVYTTSVKTGLGLDNFKKNILKGYTYCFIGSSGVGKSSILNKLMDKEIAKTNEISQYSDRGKHVTTHRELFLLESGGIIIDCPGMRELGVLESEKGISDVFSEIDKFAKKCKFNDCSHISEPGCAVLKALEDDELDDNKYNHFIKISKENAYNNMNKNERRQKDKKFGKFIKNVKKDIKKYKSI